MIRFFIIVLSLFLFLASCFNQVKSYDKEAGKTLFSYDPGQSLDQQLEEVAPESLAKEPPQGITAYKFSINGGGSPRVDSGILEFITEAMRLAAQGAVCVVPEGSFPWTTFPQGDQRDVIAVKDQIVELRRMLDFLYQQANVDRDRIGFIGHDYGAMHGALLSAADSRLVCAVLMTGIGEYWAWNRILNISIGNSEEYKKMFYAYDPIRLIDLVAPTTLLFQFSDNDNFISKEDADENLVIDAIKGKSKALEGLIQRYQHWIYNLVLRMVYDPIKAEDITQEILIKIITKLNTFKAKSKFKTWLYRIACNLVINMKKCLKEKKGAVTFSAYWKEIKGIPDSDFPDTQSQGVETKLIIDEIQFECMLGMLICLKRTQRLAFILGALFQFEDTAACEIMGVKRDNFRKILSRAAKDFTTL